MTTFIRASFKVPKVKTGVELNVQGFLWAQVSLMGSCAISERMVFRTVHKNEEESPGTWALNMPCAGVHGTVGPAWSLPLAQYLISYNIPSKS